MSNFIKVVKSIKGELESSPFINTISYGSLFDVDLKKQTIFPLGHLSVDNVQYGEQVITYTFSILCMDLVDINKDSNVDEVMGNDNTMYIWNTQQAVITKLLNTLKNGDILEDGFQLLGNPNLEPFKERFGNLLAGWAVTFEIEVANTIDLC
jgi:hypothetical protein